MKKSGVSGALRRAIFRRDGYTCKACGLLGKEQRFQRGGYGYPTEVRGIYLSIDHVVPRARGGGSSSRNLRVLCTRCNRRKGTLPA